MEKKGSSGEVVESGINEIVRRWWGGENLKEVDLIWK